MDGQTAVNPTQKSLLQMEFLIRACHQATGGWVVVLCCGSGTGVIAALRNQLNVVAFDIMQQQVDFTKHRVDTFLQSEVRLTYFLCCNSSVSASHAIVL